MRQTQLFGKTRKNKPKDEVSTNAELLIRAGFIDKLTGGVYTFLPLGLCVLKKIIAIIREEMNDVGGQELLMPALQPKDNWLKTGRWTTMDILYKVASQTGQEYALGPTHEEVIVPLVKNFVQSYKDLPLYLYQIQTKFRDELRPKSGLVRGREFLMKDFYSFHASEDDLENFYEKMIPAYMRVFSRCGLEAFITEASGGSFTKKHSHEFQVPTPAGEDVIFLCQKCKFAFNKEVIKSKTCAQCGGALVETKGVEVGNIFNLGKKFSDDFDLMFADGGGTRQPIFIGCYGIGVSRLMGTVAEVLHDEAGLRWPTALAPFDAHLIPLGNDVAETTSETYDRLRKEGIDVLIDDRIVSAGEKFADADLIGIPIRLVVSSKSLEQGGIEVKRRGEKETKIMKVAEVINYLKSK